MTLSYFFRKLSPVFHSIEEQFFAIQKALPEDVLYTNKFAKYHSKGLFKRIFITIQSAFNQGDVNHITGDIHFIALLLKKKKTILTVHDIGSILNKNGIRVKILRFFWFTLPFARVKYITVISEFTKNEILQQFNINPQKIIVIPDCVSPKFKFSPKNFNTSKPNILQIGTKPNKNPENLIRALEGISCKLTIVGKLTEKQINLLKNKKIDYICRFNISQNEIVQLYQDTDFVSFVSTYEGFGVPVLEAQATGRVVLTSDISPMKEVAGTGAVLTNPSNISDIRSKIIEIIKNSELRNKVIKAGLENVKKYSAPEIAKKYSDIYKQIYHSNN